MSASAPAPFRARRGFTLIELLTVIAIIGILSAIIVPTVGAVRARATQSKVQSNLRQLGVAMRAYATDNRDHLPCANYNFGSGLIAPWDQVILPYLGLTTNPQGWVAPTAETLFFHPNDQAAPNPDRARHSFAMPREGSAVIGGQSRTPVGHVPKDVTSRPDYRRGTHLSKIANQSRVILLTERRNMENNSFVNSGTYADINVNDLKAQLADPELTHRLNGNGTLDFLFVDGHVKAMKLEDTVGKEDFGSVTKPKGMWFVQ